MKEWMHLLEEYDNSFETGIALIREEINIL
jgi:hypothetical protein